MRAKKKKPTDPVPRERVARDAVVAVVPACNEGAHIRSVIADILAHLDHVIVIDDGSSDDTTEQAQAAGAEVIRHEVNQGKGMALKHGFDRAREQGYTLIICLDGDGQHDPGSIPDFIEAYERTGIPVLVGNRMTDVRGMPLVRRLTNRFMSRMLGHYMKQYVPDTQCGYRLYRTDVLPFVTAHSGGFAAESEILLYIADRGIRMGSVRVKTIYGDEKSKINPLRDTARFIQMIRRYRRTRRRT